MNETRPIMLTISRPQAPAPAEAHLAGAGAPAQDEAGNDAQEVMQMVLQMLREHMGMDVVFVSQSTQGDRRSRVVDAANPGPEVAMAAGQLAPVAPVGTPLSIPVILRDGRLYGMLCCFSDGGDAAVAERDLRSLRYSARLAARLLDNLQILRDLNRKALRH